MAELNKKRFAETLLLIKFSGDSITSSQLMGLPMDYLGINFNDGAVGLGGLASALISCYNVYPSAKK